MRLDVYLDLGNLAGYLALSGTRKLIDETGIDTQWLPIAGIIPRPFSREVKLTKGGQDADPLLAYKRKRWEAKHRHEQAELERDCARLGLKPEIAGQHWEAHLTHLAWLALLDQGVSPVPYIEAVYHQRLVLGQDIQHADALSAVLIAADIDPALVADLSAFESRWQAHEAAYLALGIHDSPAYVLNEETFQGRQHLPLLEWRITGEKGPPPL